MGISLSCSCKAATHMDPASCTSDNQWNPARAEGDGLLWCTGLANAAKGRIKSSKSSRGMEEMLENRSKDLKNGNNWAS